MNRTARRWPCLGMLSAALLISACDGDDIDDFRDSVESGDFEVERVFEDSDFASITDVQSQPDAQGDDRLFVVEKAGRIRFLPVADRSPEVETFLDIREVSDFSTAGEGGLLGLAFDPGFAANGYFYVHYTKTDPRRVVIARFTSDATPPVSTDTQEIILEVEYPERFTNHVAGALAFGPVDGLLYLTMGDGGGGFDPEDNAQDRRNLLGAVLRIDVSTTGTGGDLNYTIPQANPFFANGQGFREEIFAYGLRNPFRLSIDQPDFNTQRIWVGDVGQNEREEVNLITAGSNYGWDCREGTRRVEADERSPLCQGRTDADFVSPEYEYDTDADFGESITGGYVYRGTRLPALAGRYVYGDFVSGRIWAYDAVTQDNKLLVDSDLAISSFGTDSQGALYIADFGDDGGLYRLVR